MAARKDSVAPDEGANQEEIPKEETVKAVRYVGTADVREITKAQWASIGVDDQDKTVWSAQNDFTIKASDLSEKALAYFAKDDGFKVVEIKA